MKKLRKLDAGYKIKMKAKNEALIKLMNDSGIKSISDLSRQSGVYQSFISSIINLTIDSPFSACRTKYKDSVTKLAEFLGVIESEIFPCADDYPPIGNNPINLIYEDIDINDIASDCSPELTIIKGEFSASDIIFASGIPKRMMECIKLRLVDNLRISECSKKLGVEVERAIKLEKKAIILIKARIERNDNNLRDMVESII